MAARVAAELGREADVRVELVSGGLGELSVSVDGHKAVDTSRLLYPLPGRVVRKVRALLSAEAGRTAEPAETS